LAFYEKLTSVTGPRRRAYSRYDIQWASGVDGNRHLKCITNEVKTIAAGTVSQSLDERVGISQSSVQVLEEPNGITLTVDDLNFTSIGRGVDQGGQENDSNGKSAVEDHFAEWVGKGELLASSKHPATYISNCRRPLIDQMVSTWHLYFLVDVKMRQDATRHTVDWRASDQMDENPPRGSFPSSSGFDLPSRESSAEYIGGNCPSSARRQFRIPSPCGNTESSRGHSGTLTKRW
jgi:hypothetical protein